ncbi:MAG: NAD(+) synthase [Gracilibacteraceae bacterium]|jgi:NAD+ synthase (glutamine-hydrolysing)|nr:NAD(+) synthase [Gracilibacteraceae bacterium]
MRDGYVRVAAAAPFIRVADCASNTARIIERMDEAAAAGAGLLALPELCVTGYTCGDLFGQEALTEKAAASVAEILTHSRARPELTVVAGFPLRLRGKLYNCAAVMQGGELLGIVPKTWLPNYGEFYETRWFTRAPCGGEIIRFLGRETPFGTRRLFTAENMENFTFGVEICEDLWVSAPPSIRLAQAGARLIVNLSAGDEVAGKAEYRRRLVRGQSARLLCGYVYAAAGEGESTTDMVFAGHHLIAENGRLLAEAELFAGRMVLADLDVNLLTAERQKNTSFQAEETAEAPVTTSYFTAGGGGSGELLRPLSRTPFVPEDEAGRRERCRSILAMQARGLAARVRHMGARRMLLGLSGGLDSTLALLVMCRAADLLGMERRDVLAVALPCFGTTERTARNARELAVCAGADFRTVDIREAVRGHLRDIGHAEGEYGIVFENAQARERTQVLMDLANAMGGLAVGTGDLSELALGWCTYGGDHMSMYAVNAGIPKTLVRYLVETEEHICREQGAVRLASVLADIRDTPISPELLPAEGGRITQRTEEEIGPYVLNDFFLYYIVRFGFRPRKVFRLAALAFRGEYEPSALREALTRFYRRFFSQQFKRSCLPDGPKIGAVTLSPRGDWRMPSDACAALWLEEAEGLA